METIKTIFRVILELIVFLVVLEMFIQSVRELWEGFGENEWKNFKGMLKEKYKGIQKKSEQ